MRFDTVDFPLLEQPAMTRTLKGFSGWKDVGGRGSKSCLVK